MPYLQPAVSDRELFTGTLHTSATDGFMIIGPAQIKQEQGVAFHSYLHYLRDASAPVPFKQKVVSMSFSFNRCSV